MFAFGRQSLKHVIFDIIFFQLRGPDVFINFSMSW